MVGARGSFVEATNFFFYFLKILNLWLRLSATEAEKRSMASGNDQGQKGVPFSLALICLGS